MIKTAPDSSQLTAPLNSVTSEIWLHVDLNAYFATLIQQEVPALRGKPLVIVKEAGRTCVIAASKEAKKLGVKTGTSVAEAQILIPTVKIVPAAFNQYQSATKQLYKLFMSLSPDVELFSLDEAFIFYTSIQHLYPTVQHFAQLVQQKIKQSLGEWVTCNVGIGPNRLIAKMTSEQAPKGSICQTLADDVTALLARTSFVDVCGVGRALSARLARLGVFTPLQITFLDDATLKLMFGPFWSKELRKIGLGEEPQFLAQFNSRNKLKSVSRSITTYTFKTNPQQIKAILCNLASECVDKMRALHLASHHSSIFLSGHDRFWQHHFATQFPLHQQLPIQAAIQQLINQWPKTFPVLRFGVRLDALSSFHPTPLLPEYWKLEVVQQALDRINTKYGIFTLRTGALLPMASLIRPEVTGFLGDKIYQLRD